MPTPWASCTATSSPATCWSTTAATSGSPTSAWPASEGTGDLTRAATCSGPCAYMSPEQAAGGRVLDVRTDVYSLGATLYELLTGRPALDGDDRQELLRRIAHDEPIPPRRLDPAIPRDLETIVGKAMAKEPERRYASARELAEDLGRFLEDRPIRARRPGPMERTGAVVATAQAGDGLGRGRCWSSCRWPRPAGWRGSGRNSGGPGRPWTTAQEARRRRASGPDLHVHRLGPGRRPGAGPDRLARAVAGAGRGPVATGSSAARRWTTTEEIAGRYRDDPEMPAIVAAADHRIGFIRMILKEPDAEEAYRRSIALYERLLAAAPSPGISLKALARGLLRPLPLLRTTGETALALDCFP